MATEDFKTRLNISEYIASNENITNLNDSIQMDIANSEKTMLFIGPPRVNYVDYELLEEMLYTVLGEFVKARNVTSKDIKKVILDIIEDTTKYETYLTNVREKCFIIGNIQQAALNARPNVVIQTMIGSTRKRFADSDFMSEWSMSLGKVLVYGPNFLSAIMNYIVPIIMESATATIADSTSFNSYVSDWNENLATAADITAGNIQVSFLAYCYDKLLNPDTTSAINKFPFGLGMILQTRGGDVLGVPYLENCVIMGQSSGLSLEQPVVLDRMEVQGSNFIAYNASKLDTNLVV
jgi:hypothetical protein